MLTLSLQLLLFNKLNVVFQQVSNIKKHRGINYQEDNTFCKKIILLKLKGIVIRKRREHTILLSVIISGSVSGDKLKEKQKNIFSGKMI